MDQLDLMTSLHKQALEGLKQQIQYQESVDARGGVESRRLILSLKAIERYSPLADVLEVTLNDFERAIVEKRNVEVVELRRRKCIEAISSFDRVMDTIR